MKDIGKSSVAYNIQKLRHQVKNLRLKEVDFYRKHIQIKFEKELYFLKVFNANFLYYINMEQYVRASYMYPCGLQDKIVSKHKFIINKY
jgi:hypothetical protein